MYIISIFKKVTHYPDINIPDDLGCLSEYHLSTRWPIAENNKCVITGIHLKYAHKVLEMEKKWIV